MDKKQLRKELKALRNSFSQDSIAESSRLTAEHILKSDLYRQAKCIMGYLAFGKELSVDAVLQQALADCKTVCVPYIVSDTEFVPVQITDFDDFVMDRYQIRSVKNADRKIAAAEIDMVLVPGVAFDFSGGRMGMGAGYYDRFLVSVPQAKLMGIAYSSMIQPELPCTEYDIPVTYIANEKGIFKAAGGR